MLKIDIKAANLANLIKYVDGDPKTEEVFLCDKKHIGETLTVELFYLAHKAMYILRETYAGHDAKTWIEGDTDFKKKASKYFGGVKTRKKMATRENLWKHFPDQVQEILIDMGADLKQVHRIDYGGNHNLSFDMYYIANLNEHLLTSEDSDHDIALYTQTDAEFIKLVQDHNLALCKGVSDDMSMPVLSKENRIDFLNLDDSFKNILRFFQAEDRNLYKIDSNKKDKSISVDLYYLVGKEKHLLHCVTAEAEDFYLEGRSSFDELIEKYSLNLYKEPKIITTPDNEIPSVETMFAKIDFEDLESGIKSSIRFADWQDKPIFLVCKSVFRHSEACLYFVRGPDMHFVVVDDGDEGKQIHAIEMSDLYDQIYYHYDLTGHIEEDPNEDLPFDDQDVSEWIQYAELKQPMRMKLAQYGTFRRIKVLNQVHKDGNTATLYALPLLNKKVFIVEIVDKKSSHIADLEDGQFWPLMEKYDLGDPDEWLLSFDKLGYTLYDVSNALADMTVHLTGDNPMCPKYINATRQAMMMHTVCKESRAEHVNTVYAALDWLTRELIEQLDNLKKNESIEFPYIINNPEMAKRGWRSYPSSFFNISYLGNNVYVMVEDDSEGFQVSAKFLDKFEVVEEYRRKMKQFHFQKLKFKPLQMPE